MQMACGTGGPSAERRIRQQQVGDRLPADQMLLDDPFEVGGRAVVIPGAVRVDHHDRPPRADAQAVGLGAQQAAEHALGAQLAQARLEVLPARELAFSGRALPAHAEDYVAPVAPQVEFRGGRDECLLHASDSAMSTGRQPGAAAVQASERLVVRFPGADADRALQVGYEDLPVADLAGARRAYD